MTPALFVQSAVIGLSIGSIYILMALGLTLMFGMMHIINFAHGAVYMLGAFVIYYVFFQGGMPYFVAFVASMVLLGIFGYLVERSIYRPIKGGIEPTLVALLALTTFLQAAGIPVFGQLDKHVPPFFPGTRNILGVGISVERLMIIPVAGALVIGLYLFINKTRLGAAMRAIEQDKEAAALQGVNVHVVNGLAFAIGFALAAASGALMAPIFKLAPMMGEQPLLKAFIIIILAASLRPSLTCGQLNIGHSAFMSIGAYTSALLAKNLAVPFEISLLGGALLAAAVGLVIGYPALRLRGVYFAMVTVAFVEVIRLIAQLWVSLTRGMSGLSGIPKPSVLGMTLTSRASQYYLVVGLTLVILLVLWKLEHSRLGLIWKSIGMADNLAQSLGVTTARHKLLAFMLGCFFAGTAGAFYAPFIRFLFL